MVHTNISYSQGILVRRAAVRIVARPNISPPVLPVPDTQKIVARDCSTYLLQLKCERLIYLCCRCWHGLVRLIRILDVARLSLRRSESTLYMDVQKRRLLIPRPFVWCARGGMLTQAGTLNPRRRICIAQSDAQIRVAHLLEERRNGNRFVYITTQDYSTIKVRNGTVVDKWNPETFLVSSQN